VARRAEPHGVDDGIGDQDPAAFGPSTPGTGAAFRRWWDAAPPVPGRVGGSFEGVGPPFHRGREQGHGWPCDPSAETGGPWTSRPTEVNPGKTGCPAAFFVGESPVGYSADSGSRDQATGQAHCLPGPQQGPGRVGAPARRARGGGLSSVFGGAARRPGRKNSPQFRLPVAVGDEAGRTNQRPVITPMEALRTRGVSRSASERPNDCGINKGGHLGAPACSAGRTKVALPYPSVSHRRAQSSAGVDPRRIVERLVRQTLFRNATAVMFPPPDEKTIPLPTACPGAQPDDDSGPNVTAAIIYGPIATASPACGGTNCSSEPPPPAADHRGFFAGPAAPQKPPLLSTPRGAIVRRDQGGTTAGRWPDSHPGLTSRKRCDHREQRASAARS